jgi:hypothetical protein
MCEVSVEVYSIAYAHLQYLVPGGLRLHLVTS